jgi:hypothetical protein
LDIGGPHLLRNPVQALEVPCVGVCWNGEGRAVRVRVWARQRDPLAVAPHKVRFRHPAYPSTIPSLLVLMAVDGGGGLDFDITLAACCIVADTDWEDGYLAQRASAGNLNPILQQVGRPLDLYIISYTNMPTLN